MNSIDRIFKEKLINNYLEKFTNENIPDFERKWKIIKKWKQACEQRDLENTKETQIQGAFFVQIFDEVLGYTTVTSKEGDIFNQKQEFNSVLDTSEADGGLGFFSEKQKLNDVRVVIELKDAKKNLDKKQNRSNHLTPVEQGFSYANKNGSKCGWVIVSNFIETRLYKSNSSLEYEKFELTKMDNKEEFLRFYFLLCKEHLIEHDGKSLIDTLYEENEAMGVALSNDFYKTYKGIRNNLYKSIKETNPQKNELLLFTKSQKIMDRFIFICFCEDCGLLPSHTFSKIINSAQNSFSFSNTKIWDELRGLFLAIDIGNPPMKINKYNGGLFRKDEELDSLVIENEVLEEFTRLSAYDFNSDLNVNILGQIFEQSISDVEEIKNEINGVETDKTKKQKEDGIFYTPYYATRYIVAQTVGAFLNEKKEEVKRNIFSSGSFKTEVYRDSTKRKNIVEIKNWVDIPEEKIGISEEEKIYRKAVCNLHEVYWTQYEDILRNIKICDPACGSGAFLNQCFDYLHEEMNFVVDMKRLLNENQISLFDIDKSILQNNLYGVDINEESVEITKLSLWLKTAKKNQTLASLDNNIKCGNSIVADREIAGNSAFNWKTEFKEVFDNGGFDIVIGNPPYGAKLSDVEKEYITNNYITTEYNFDTYKTFFELGLNIVKSDGYLGYITPNTFFALEQGANKLRKFLFDNNTLMEIVEVFDVFPSAVVEPVITIFKKKIPMNEEFQTICIPRKTKLSSTFLNEGMINKFVQQDLKENLNYIFNYRNSKEEKVIKDKIRRYERLDSIFKVMTGVKPYQKGKGIPPQTKEILEEKPYTGFEKLDDRWVPYMRGRTIDRYTNMWKNSCEYIKYGEWLAEPRVKEVFEGKKIFIRQTGDCLIATFDEGNVSNNTLHSIYPLPGNKDVSLFYLLGILNSKMMNWYYQKEYYLELGKPMAEVKGIYIKKLPIVVADDFINIIEGYVTDLLRLSQEKFDKKYKFFYYIDSMYTLKSRTSKLFDFENVEYRDFLAELSKQKVKLKAAQSMELLSLFEEKQKEIVEIIDKINSVNNKLDALIYKIYDLSDEEISFIENQLKD